MKVDDAQALMAQVQTLCEKYGAFCDVVIKNRPYLEHVCMTINAKVTDMPQKNLDSV